MSFLLDELSCEKAYKDNEKNREAWGANTPRIFSKKKVKSLELVFVRTETKCLVKFLSI